MKAHYDHGVVSNKPLKQVTVSVILAQYICTKLKGFNSCQIMIKPCGKTSAVTSWQLQCLHVGDDLAAADRQL